jgi:hypothetical protein
VWAAVRRGRSAQDWGEGGGGGSGALARSFVLMGVAGRVCESTREMTGWETGGLRTASVS